MKKVIVSVIDKNKMIPIRWKGKKYWIDRNFLFNTVKNTKVITLPTNSKTFDISEDCNRLKMDRVERADLKYPIIIDPNYEVIDGLHRIKKALMFNITRLKCKIFNPDDYIDNMIQVNNFDFKEKQ
jgi:Predicted transcriptional regulators